MLALVIACAVALLLAAAMVATWPGRREARWDRHEAEALDQANLELHPERGLYRRRKRS